jgi:hypothetical protein
VVAQKSLPNELLRPVLTMPPVVLRYNEPTDPTSPIVEMPPSPAPFNHPIVEFPTDDEYVMPITQSNDDYVEVRILYKIPILIGLHIYNC